LEPSEVEEISQKLEEKVLENKRKKIPNDNRNWFLRKRRKGGMPYIGPKSDVINIKFCTK